jgi:hypothetical protein
MREELGNFAPGRSQYPRYCRAGNAHLSRSRLLIQTLVINQSDRLELIKRKVDPLKRADGHAGGLINRNDRLS